MAHGFAKQTHKCALHYYSGFYGSHRPPSALFRDCAPVILHCQGLLPFSLHSRWTPSYPCFLVRALTVKVDLNQSFRARAGLAAH